MVCSMLLLDCLHLRSQRIQRRCDDRIQHRCDDRIRTCDLIKCCSVAPNLAYPFFMASHYPRPRPKHGNWLLQQRMPAPEQIRSLLINPCAISSYLRTLHVASWQESPNNPDFGRLVSAVVQRSCCVSWYMSSCSCCSRTRVYL
jgi:hypothetical protein